MARRPAPRNEFRRDISRFADRVSLLSQKRQELIRPVHEHPRDYVLLSIREAATKLKTDPATVLRVVRGMGFGSYHDFKAYLHELSLASATSLDGMQSSAPNDSSLIAQGRRALEQDLTNLQGLRNTLDMNRLVSLVTRLYKANRILILGGDLATSLVDFLEYSLLLLGFPVIAATAPGRTTHAARSMGKKDLVIAISFRRGLRQTVEGMEQARTNGAYCVGITNTFISPIARLSDECFLTPVEASLSNSYVAPMSFFNVFLTLVAQYRRGRTLAVLKKVDQEQRHGFRWYPA